MIPFLLVLNGRHLRVWRRKRPLKHTRLHRDHAICCVALSGDARGPLCSILCDLSPCRSTAVPVGPPRPSSITHPEAASATVTCSYTEAGTDGFSAGAICYTTRRRRCQAPALRRARQPERRGGTPAAPQHIGRVVSPHRGSADRRGTPHLGGALAFCSHQPHEEGEYHERLFRGPSTNDVKK
jgi:hypothetical protein